MSDVAEAYRRKARECTEMAARLTNPEDRAAWLNLAEGGASFGCALQSLRTQMSAPSYRAGLIGCDGRVERGTPRFRARLRIATKAASCSD